MRGSKRIDKRERRPETPDSLRNSVVSLQTHSCVKKRTWSKWAGRSSVACHIDPEKILGELESEAAADEKMHKKLNKTAASAKLSTEAKNLQSDITSKQQPLDEATALRKNQIADWLTTTMWRWRKQRKIHRQK